MKLGRGATGRVGSRPAGYIELLERYQEAVPGRRYPEIRVDFERVVRRAPSPLVADGLRAALAAKDTTRVPELIVKLCRSADESLQSELIGRLAKAAGEGVSLDGSAIRCRAFISTLAQRALRKQSRVIDELCEALTRHAGLADNLDGIALTHAMVAMACGHRAVRRKR